MKKINLKKLNLNKTKTLILIAIVTLLVFVSGITYAYFQTQGGNGANANVNVLSSSTDNLIFTVEKDIYINASVANFGEGMGDLSDDTNATATLIPNNYDNTASAMYNIYIIIESNNLEYTTSNNTPELLLNVTDPNGNKLTNITGLVHYEEGFDITTRTGGFLIASDYVIEANNTSEVQNWNIEITLANLDSNQNANTGKNFSAKIYMTQEKMSSYNPVQITNIEATPTYNTIDTNLVLSNGSADVDKYYFGIEEANNQTAYINDNQVIRLSNTIASADTVTYYESETPNYEFSNLKDNTEYIIYSYAIDVNNVKSNVYETRVTTNEYALATISEVTHSVTLNSITLTVNANSGDGTITKYMYSNNDGESWVESDSNTYTFTDLSDTTEYKIRVKVVDSNGVESTEYYEAIATETYILPVVANVEYTTTYNSITLTPSGTDGTNTIDHYEYSIDNGEYQESNIFNNLNENTEYTINVKAIDINGRESNPYIIQVATDTYEIPVITNVSTSSTEDSITINVSANNGDGSITKYLYSRDNGSNWSESTNNSYTFNNLTSDTTFYIQVKVVDENGRESAVSNATIKTQYLNPVVNSVSTSNITSSSITLTVNATAGSNNITTYYYSNNNGSSYVSSSSNTYTFSGLSAGTTYNFRVYVVDSDSVKSNEDVTSARTTNPTLANYIINTVYQGDGVNGLYYHDGAGTYTNASEEAGDNSYRYSGADPNNYICLESDAEKCSWNNLYRIIGVFDSEVKIITELIQDYYVWDSGYDNTWDDSTKPDIRTTLNTTYLNSLDSNISNKIAEHTWQVGGISSNRLNLLSAKSSFRYEIDRNLNSTMDSMKIGLMYVSDYAYATSPENWLINLAEINYEARNNNWMFVNNPQWTISRSYDYFTHNSAIVISDLYGILGSGDVTESNAVRPCFYLNSNVLYVSGSGTSSDPYIIS